MKKFLLVSLLLVTNLFYAQNEGSLKGKVTDGAMNNEPMLFANIQLKGIETSYQTNFNGNFEILNLQPGAYTLIISYAGYATKELAVLIEENKIAKIEAGMNPIQFSFESVEGMNSVSQEPTENTKPIK